MERETLIVMLLDLYFPTQIAVVLLCYICISLVQLYHIFVINFRFWSGTASSIQRLGRSLHRESLLTDSVLIIRNIDFIINLILLSVKSSHQ